MQFLCISDFWPSHNNFQVMWHYVITTIRRCRNVRAKDKIFVSTTNSRLLVPCHHYNLFPQSWSNIVTHPRVHSARMWQTFSVKWRISHLSSRQSHKVVDGFGDSFPKQADDYPSDVFIPDFHVEENLWTRVNEQNKFLAIQTAPCNNQGGIMQMWQGRGLPLRASFCLQWHWCFLVCLSLPQLREGLQLCPPLLNLPKQSQ